MQFPWSQQLLLTKNDRFIHDKQMLNFPNRSKLTSLFRKQGFYVILFSVLIAFIFWLLFAFGEHYTAVLPFKVAYQNLPQDKTATKPLPGSISMKIETVGWNILKIKTSHDKYVVNIDVSRFLRTDYLITASIRNDIFFKKISDIKVIEIQPDTIYFNFEKTLSKKAPVVPVVQIDFSPQYGPAGPEYFSPHFINLSGPKSVIDGIDTVFTKSYHFSDISGNIKNLLEPDLSGYSNLTTDLNKLLFEMHVEKYAEKKLVLPINVRTNDSIQLIPDKATITFQLPLSAFNQLNSNDLSVFVKKEELNINEDNKLKVRFESQYPYTRNVRINPEYVSYVVRSK